jgi:hypothetical protein
MSPLRRRLHHLRLLLQPLKSVSAGAWSKKRLHDILFIPRDELGAFGFLDPAQVIPGVNLISGVILNFLRGRADSRFPPSIARPADDCDEDWDSFHVDL